MMNWKVLGKKRQRPNRGTILAFSWTKENHTSSHWGQTVLWQRFEPSTFWIQVYSVTATQTVVWVEHTVNFSLTIFITHKPQLVLSFRSPDFYELCVIHHTLPQLKASFTRVISSYTVIQKQMYARHQLSQYSDRLRARRSGFDSRQGQAIIICSTATRPALKPIQYCLMGTKGSFPGGKAAGAWRWPLTTI
jgi:hypothetical protein